MPYLTPDNPSEGFICRVLQIPNSTLFLSIVEGCLLDLVYPRSFEQFGDLTPEETAQLFYDMWDAFHRSVCEGGEMACCYDVVNYRITPDGFIEQSVNGGEWTSITNDPRNQIPALFPITLDGEHSKCDAAVNALGDIEDLVNGFSQRLETGQSAAELAAIIVSIIFGVLEITLIGALLIPLLLAALASVVNSTRETFLAYFTSTVWDTVRCALDCTIGEDAQFTQGQFSQFLNKLRTDLGSSSEANWLINALAVAGVRWLNNATVTGSSSDANCDDCECSDTCVDFPDNWEVTEGTEISRDATSITFSLNQREDTHWYFGVSALDWNDCCCKPVLEFLTGAEDMQSEGLCGCGLDPSNVNNYNFGPGVLLTNSVVGACLTNHQIKLTFEGCS